MAWLMKHPAGGTLLTQLSSPILLSLSTDAILGSASAVTHHDFVADSHLAQEMALLIISKGHIPLPRTLFGNVPGSHNSTPTWKAARTKSPFFQVIIT
jgi:hypothetical protein